MRKFVLEFLRRGMMACGLGPIVLAVLYLVLQRQGEIESLTVNQVCLGIFTISFLAFVAGGMNTVYQIEKLPLMAAILMHGSVLYISYLVTFLLNDWIEPGMAPILIFSCIFAVGYLLIWVIIYSMTKRNAARINEGLMQKQEMNEKKEST